MIRVLKFLVFKKKSKNEFKFFKSVLKVLSSRELFRQNILFTDKNNYQSFKNKCMVHLLTNLELSALPILAKRAYYKIKN